MKKFTSLSEFISFRYRILSEKDDQYDKPTLVVCAGTGGQASGSNDVMRIIKKYILENNLTEQVDLRVTGCQGFCEMDPFIVVEPGKHLYPKIKMEDVPQIIESAISGKINKELIYREARENKRYYSQNDIPFFKKQTRTILGCNQNLDPIRIKDYIEQGGYSAIEKVFTNLNPEWIINEVKESGLRGRGGAGFLTGRKWEFARAAGNGHDQKYIVCNADEGDPGAYMDRSLLEGNPHSIIEGMIIAGIAIGARTGFIYVRSEYPLAIKHTLIAIRQAQDLGILGNNIFGTGINFDIHIVRGAGAFVCGEETALIRSIEGKVGEPRQRPPYPIEKGINNKTTCINNVETLANIPFIINNGGREYAEIGVPGNTGTKIFSLVGKIKNTGLVEVPLGIKINEVVYDIGGGPVGKAKIKAVQTGGPSGGCIPSTMFDLPIDYDSLSKVGSIMGSGGMIVMDENTCMVDVAKYFMKFLKDESCGKCFTCRKGTQRMYETLDDISSGKGTISHMELLEELAHVVKDTTMCGLGQTAPNPVLNTLRYFKNEYERHIIEKKCDAFVCKELVGAPCQSACPLETEAWRYIAYISQGKFEAAYNVIREVNPFPSVCSRVCNHPCEERCKAGTSGGDPIAIRALKRFITDRIEPSAYKSVRKLWDNGKQPHIAVIGSGPAGLTAAHYLSIIGCKVTIFEAESKPGGMLTCAIPSYRLPREIIQKEINALIDENITVKCNSVLGQDFSIEDLFNKGFKAVLLAMGAHKSRPLNLENENAKGIYTSLDFLKSFNLRNKMLAKGHVGVIGGGNSALDSARTALRQKGVKSVTIMYRRSKDEMPAFAEEIKAAAEEGIIIKTLVSPVKITVSDGHLSGIKLIRNKLGEIDSSGRRRPVPVEGTEYHIELNTLIVAISEESNLDFVSSKQSNNIKKTSNGLIKVNRDTYQTDNPAVFAAGDLTTGPNTVIEAIAAGKKASLMIEHFLKNESMKHYFEKRLPGIYVEPSKVNGTGEPKPASRVNIRNAPADLCKHNFTEVEVSLLPEEAVYEAQRCLRCDLEFTKPEETETDLKGAAKT